MEEIKVNNLTTSAVNRNGKTYLLVFEWENKKMVRNWIFKLENNSKLNEIPFSNEKIDFVKEDERLRQSDKPVNQKPKIPKKPPRPIESFETKSQRIFRLLDKIFPGSLNTTMINEQAGFIKQPGVSKTILEDFLVRQIIEIDSSVKKPGNYYKLKKNEKSKSNGITIDKNFSTFEKKSDRIIKILEMIYPKWANTKSLNDLSGYKKFPGLTRLILDDLIIKNKVKQKQGIHRNSRSENSGNLFRLIKNVENETSSKEGNEENEGKKRSSLDRLKKYSIIQSEERKYLSGNFFEMINKGSKGIMALYNSKYYLLRGSVISKDCASYFPTAYKGIHEFRQSLIKDKTLELLPNGMYLLKKDIEFLTHNTAACFCSGSTINGFKEWKLQKDPQISLNSFLDYKDYNSQPLTELPKLEMEPFTINLTPKI